MERIGRAASKIAKGNFFIYNLFVVLISSLFSLLVFFLSGCAIVITLVIIAYLSARGKAPDLESGWMPVMLICLISLGAVVFILNLCAILKNIRFRRNP